MDLLLDPVHLVLLLQMFLPGIRRHVPKHAAHEGLLGIEVAGQLVGVEEEPNLAHGLLDLFIVGVVIVRDGVGRYRLPFGKVVMRGNSMCRRE